MALKLHPRRSDAVAAPRHRDDLSEWDISAESLPKFAPWKLSWSLFLLLLVFAGNVVLAVVAWVIVGFVMG